jgi:dihydroorotate dehydrogenase
VLHDLATALARWVDGFVLVNGLQRRVVKADGAPAFPGPGRELADISGDAVWDHSRVQVLELMAWRKAGAWDRAILAVGGITTVERARAALASGAQASMVATAALVDPLLAARFRIGGRR